MNKSQKKLRTNSGTALLIAIGYVAILSIISSTFVVYLNRSISRTSVQERTVLARNLAEAGIDKALAELKSGNAAYTGETNTPLGQGTFSVSVTRGALQGEYIIESTGSILGGPITVATSRVKVRAVISPSGGIRKLAWQEANS